jgi:hypothetical protein
MKKIETIQMVEISGGTFCQGVYVVEAAYGIGVITQLWNPVGWGGAVIMIGLNGYCAFK